MDDLEYFKSKLNHARSSKLYTIEDIKELENKVKKFEEFLKVQKLEKHPLCTCNANSDLGCPDCVDAANNYIQAIPAYPEMVPPTLNKEELPDTNPKTRFGIAKPSMFVVSPIAMLHMSQAMMDGARKYGPYNWRENSVSAKVYYDAAMRHLMCWMDGQENASDSNVHHLGHAMACLNILLDAQATGCLVDDRAKSEGFVVAKLIESMTKPQT